MIIAAFALHPFAAAAADNAPAQPENDSAPKQVLISKSERYSSQSASSSVIIQTLVKALTVDIPSSSDKTTKPSVAE
jgi:hypothetical protein